MKPTLVKKGETWIKRKKDKVVWEYNKGQFDKVDIAKTKVIGRYPEAGWAANKVSTMLYYLLSGSAILTLEAGEKFRMKSDDVFILPPNTWYSIDGKFEALMVCSPVWTSDQSIKKD